jgi:hypothetical protein
MLLFDGNSKVRKEPRDAPHAVLGIVGFSFVSFVVVVIPLCGYQKFPNPQICGKGVLGNGKGAPSVATSSGAD